MSKEVAAGSPKLSVRAIIFGLMSIGFFAITGYLLVQDANWSAAGRGAVAFLAAGMCALIAYLDRIQSIRISLSAIEATTREVERVVSETRATLQQLHTFAEMNSEIVVNQLSGSGRWDGYGPNEIEFMRGRIRAGLQSIGVPPDAVQRVMRADTKWVEIDYSLGIINSIRKLEAPDDSPRKLADNLLHKWNKESFRPSPADLEEIVKAAAIGDVTVKELIEDYRYYAENGAHRRPDVWLARDTWRR